MDNTSDLSLQDELLEAMKLISDAGITGIKADVTVEADIVKQVNLETGEYKVTYKQNTFSAFSLDVMTVYPLGEQVYVHVPQGDFSATKIIQGRVTRGNVTATELIDMRNNVEQVGPDWDSWYRY
jgi:hypothetical protein